MTHTRNKISGRKEIYISVDVETSGPIPGEYSMLSIGACDALHPANTFYCELKPITNNALADDIAVTGFTLEGLARDGLTPEAAMQAFSDWLTDAAGKRKRRVFVGLNAPFDWSFVNYYFHRFLGSNPFGHSALDLKALYMGAVGCSWRNTTGSNMAAQLKPRLSGTHNALDDALYQGELFRLIRSELIGNIDEGA